MTDWVELSIFQREFNLNMIIKQSVCIMMNIHHMMNSSVRRTFFAHLVETPPSILCVTEIQTDQPNIK